jgi:deazaflavin-dependent oxidoreductase (nitroreductase family)
MSQALDTAEAFNRRVIAEFRTNGGRVGGSLQDSPIVLVHHRGAKSGMARVTPLIYHALDDARFVIAGSNGGAHAHPGWYHNVKANPSAEVEVGTERFTVRVKVLEGPARAAIWRRMVERSPNLGRFQAQARREIPLVLLTRER